MHLTRELLLCNLIFSVVGSICQRISNTPVIFCHLMMKILDSLIFFAQSEVKILRPITVYLYLLNSEKFFTRTSTGMKIFIVYFWHNKTKQNQQFQNESPAVAALKNIFKVIYLCFLQMTWKSMISIQTKMLNICFINLMTGQNLQKEKNFLCVAQQK